MSLPTLSPLHSSPSEGTVSSASAHTFDTWRTTRGAEQVVTPFSQAKDFEALDWPREVFDIPGTTRWRFIPSEDPDDPKRFKLALHMSGRGRFDYHSSTEGYHLISLIVA